MTLEEAIREQELALADKWCPWSKKLKASIQLGIEALKRIKFSRETDEAFYRLPLSGETEK